MDVHEIYGLLFAGKKLEMSFYSPEERETFKVRLHQVKAMNEKPMLELGMLQETEIQRITFTYVEIALNGILKYLISLTPRPPKKQYTVKILED